MRRKNMEELLEAWQTVLGRKFTCLDRPGAAFTPDTDNKLPGEDIVPWEEFDECVKALRVERAAGSDETQIEACLALQSAMQELYKLVCLM